MLVRPILAFLAVYGLACLAQANELDPQLPSLALNPPPASSPWSELYEVGQFTSYAAPSVGPAMSNAAPNDVPASAPASDMANSSSIPKPGPTPGHLDYDFGNNVHMHLGIVVDAVVGGSIRH